MDNVWFYGLNLSVHTLLITRVKNGVWLDPEPYAHGANS